MNFPLKSDLQFVKNLKEGDQVYFVSAGWNSDKGDVSVNVEALIFKSFDTDTKVFDKNHTTIMGNLSSNEKTVKHNLFYGFYPSPLDALKAFQKFTNSFSKAANKAVKDEEKRLEMLVSSMVKKNEN